jgi:hypothetical protein
MRNSFLIWIPSLQSHFPFFELSNAQYRVILKNLDADNHLGFLYNINNIIKENLISVDIFDKLTVIDRFIIMTYFKIQAINQNLELKRVCHKCGKDNKLFLDLEHMLSFLSDKIDRSFREHISIDDYPVAIICDVPSIRKEYSTLISAANYNIDQSSLDYRLNNYLTSFIAGLSIGGTEYILENMGKNEQQELLSKIPHSMISHIKDDYINKIHAIFDKVVFFKFHCSECSEEFELKLHSDNIHDMTKMIFRDASLEMLLGDYYAISLRSHLTGDFLDKLSYSEVKMFKHFNELANTQESPTPSSTNEANLFDDYSSEIAHMSQSPSDL